MLLVLILICVRLREINQYGSLESLLWLSADQNACCVCRCIWRDGSDTWQAFLDVCPHRLIPLSEGRITDNKELQCAYHGWCFESSGKCTAIPQGGNASNPRTWATVYQCAVKQGELAQVPSTVAPTPSATTETACNHNASLILFGKTLSKPCLHLSLTCMLAIPL